MLAVHLPTRLVEYPAHTITNCQYCSFCATASKYDYAVDICGYGDIDNEQASLLYRENCISLTPSCPLTKLYPTTVTD